MARSLNKVSLIGNLGNDPETRYTPNGGAVVTLSVATSDTWKDKTTGQQQDRTEWHRVVIFGRLAEIAQNYTKKGSKIYVEGKLQTRKWQTQEGQDRYSTEIIVDSFNGQLLMLDSRSDGTMSSTFRSGEIKQESNAYSSQLSSPIGGQQAKKYDTVPMPQMPTMQVPNNQHENQPLKKVEANTYNDKFEDDIPF